MEGSNKAAPDDIENPHIPLLATSIREELGYLSPLSSDCCIFRVPERLRHLNEKAYRPRVISIGPLHHGDPALRAMEGHKKRYLQYFLNRTPISLEKFLQKIRSQEANLRSCYAETIDIESDEFVRIILIDATFILELLLRCYFEEYERGRDPIFNKPMMIYDIWPDMLLLENQLPFFILEDLLNLHYTEAVSSYSSTKPVSIGNLSLNFFHKLLIVKEPEGYRLERVRSSHAQVEHFVDFMRRLCLPVVPGAAGVLNSLTTPSITDLYRAGVTFKTVPNKRYIFDLDIQFTNGVLTIPRITIQDQTAVIIRNLIAFEQCAGSAAMGNYITDYVIMMDRFVNTPKDVDLLVEKGIIEDALGDSQAVSTLINALGNGVVCDYSQFYYAAVCEELNNYYNSFWHRWKAYMRENYYANTPCEIISVMVAVFLIIPTMIQTVCSIISL